MSVTPANDLVSSKLDYCNSLLYGINKKQLRRLQGVQNTLCRILCHLPKYSWISNELKKLHWLPVEYRIQFKLLLLAYKALNTNQPPYLRASLQQYSCDRTTRRSNPANKILKVPSFQHKAYKSKHHFNLTFEYAVPTLWNSLPINVRTSPSLGTFRSRLKGYLFSLAYPP